MDLLSFSATDRTAPPSMNPPAILAKGIGRQASLILSIARFHEIPIRVQPGLAVSLSNKAGGSASVPQKHWDAIINALKEILATSDSRDPNKWYRDLDAKTFPRFNPLEVQVGESLIKLVSTKQGGTFLDDIKQLRKDVALKLGFVFPPVRIRDNCTFASNQYRILVWGTQIRQGVIYPDRSLAVPRTRTKACLEGRHAKNPLDGRPGMWINRSLKTRAEKLGYDILEPVKVLTSALDRTVGKFADSLREIPSY